VTSSGINKLFQSSSFRDFIGIVFGIQVVLVLLRIFETVLLNSYHIISTDLIWWELYGLWDDLSYFSVLILIFSPFYFLLAWRLRKLANVLFVLLAISLFCFQFCLAYYFNEALVPLSVTNLSGMTTDQAEMIVDLYGVKKVYALFLIPLAALFVLVIRKVKRFGSQRKRWIAPASLLCLSASITFVYPLQEDKFASEINYHVIINKIKFFEESYHSQIEEQRLISN